VRPLAVARGGQSNPVRELGQGHDGGRLRQSRRRDARCVGGWGSRKQRDALSVKTARCAVGPHPEFLPQPGPAQLRRLGLRHRDRHERAGLGEAALQATNALKDLVPVLQATVLDPFLELLQGPRQATPLAAANGALLLAPWPTAGQEIVHSLSLEQLYLDIGIVFQTLPATGAQVLRERSQLTALGGQQIPAARSAQELQRLLADHAPVHDPDPLRFPEPRLDRCDDGLDGLEILRVARECQVGQRETVTSHDQRQHDLFAIGAVIAGITALGQVVLLGQALEVGTGQVVEQQVVVELEQSAELVLQVVLDGLVGLE
jgi:hypothetical protein